MFLSRHRLSLPQRYLAVVSLALVVPQAAGAQIGLNQRGPVEDETFEGTSLERKAWNALGRNEPLRARALAEKAIKRGRSSYIGHFVLGQVHQYVEANFPRALYHYSESLRLFESQHGRKPSRLSPWPWHARLLKETAEVYGHLERFSERLAYMARFNELYEPKFVAERAWPLMKLGRIDEARQAARAGIETGDQRQVGWALNALCAIEFEAGYDGASYDACKRALEHSRDARGEPSPVDLTNLSEAARSLFRLDEAERLALEATELEQVSYGNPWIELAELYLREGRFVESLAALKEVHGYRLRRPPHLQESDRNEGRRALAAFFVAIGRPGDALEVTAKAVVSPDRRAHNSRDPGQDRAIVALLDRLAMRIAAEMELEQSAWAPFYKRWVAQFEAGWLRLRGWLSGRQVVRLLSNRERLGGVFRVGTARSAVIPPWLVGDLVDLLGPGVVLQVLREVRLEDKRPEVRSYYKAFAAEAHLRAGHSAKALLMASQALQGLVSAEVLLRARTHAVAAEAAFRLRRMEQAVPHYESALQRDPGVFRRLGLAVPVVVAAPGSSLERDLFAGVERSPRFHQVREGFAAVVSGGRLCLRGSTGSVMGCSAIESPQGRGGGTDATVRRTLEQWHQAIFAPRVALTQADANSLDGSNRLARDPTDPSLDKEKLDEFL